MMATSTVLLWVLWIAFVLLAWVVVRLSRKVERLSNVVLLLTEHLDPEPHPTPLDSMQQLEHTWRAAALLEQDQ